MQDREKEREYFDRLASDRGEFNPFADAGWDKLAKRFREYVPLAHPFSILDIGSGTGQSRQIYMSDGDGPTAPSNYVGIDLSAKSLKIAQNRYQADRWLVADACLLPFAESTFDVVAFSSVLHHIVGFADAVKEAVRVLRPGGHIFAYDPNVLHPAMALFRHPRSPLYSQNGVSPDEKPLAARQLAQVFRKCGLVNLRQRAQSDIPYRYVAPKTLNALLSLYNRCDRLWDRCGLGYWFGTFVITAAQKPVS